MSTINLNVTREKILLKSKQSHSKNGLKKKYENINQLKTIVWDGNYIINVSSLI